MKNSRLISSPALWLALSMISAGSMAYYVADIWSVNQPAGFSDLYAPWWAAHELLLHGRNPYSPAVAHEIQTVIYGASVVPSPDDPAGLGGGFAYPPYAALLFWPSVYAPFPAAQKIFLLTSVLVTLLSLTLWLRAFRLRLSPLFWVTAALFVLGSFPVLQALKLQNLSLLAAAFIAITLFLLSNNRLILSGIFLAACTFKPQFTVALIPWLVLWTLADWRRRRSLLWSFLISMLVLALVSEWLVPGWIPSFVHVVGAYRHYTYGHSLLDVWFTPSFGPIASIILLLAVLALGWPHRSEPADSPTFFLVTSLLLAANVVVIPTLAPHAQLLLLPGVLCLLPGVHVFWTSAPFGRILRVAAWMLLVWPWVATLGLLLAALRLPSTALYRLWEIPLYTSPLLPLAVALALAFLVLGRPSARNQGSVSLPRSLP